MVNKKVLFILTAFIILLFSSVSLAAIPVDVTVGKETILNLKEPSKRLSIANPDIASIVLISPSEIIINGKKPGITSLIVWNDEEKPTFFDVIVYKERLIEFEKEKADALADKIKEVAPDSNIKVEFAGDTLVLNGIAKNRLLIDKIEKIAMLYGTKGCSGISRGCSLPAGCAQPGGQEVTPGQGFVSVNVAQQAMQQAQPEAQALCVLNLITMPEAQQVILEVKVAQIDKTKLKQLGISFLAKEKNYEFTSPGFYSSPTGTIGGLVQEIGSFDLSTLSPQIGFAYFPGGVAAVLQALQQKGLSKILAEPNLIVRSGEQGNFLVGKRIPVQTVYGIGTAATPSITYEEVGVRLNFTPEVLETGAIRLKINPAEVSSVARYVVYQGIVAPEIDTRTVNTSVDLREGESLVLAGLLSQEMKDSIQKVPILADIPILGALFRSTSKELDETELAFFITPRLVKPFAPGVKPTLPTDNHPTPEEEKDYEWIPVP
jgi:pilus assembly protein CpaC